MRVTAMDDVRFLGIMAIPQIGNGARLIGYPPGAGADAKGGQCALLAMWSDRQPAMSR